MPGEEPSTHWLRVSFVLIFDIQCVQMTANARLSDNPIGDLGAKQIAHALKATHNVDELE